MPRSTLRYWLDRFAGVAQPEEAIGLKPIKWGFESLHQHQHQAYAYLLGVYLGDGDIARLPRAYVLRVYLHHSQHDVIERVRRSISTLLPNNRVNASRRRGSAVVVVTCYSQSWPAIFPQHGPGRKHLRPIVLQPWQEAIVRRHPGDFMQGCIDTDGSRHRRIVNGKNYPAYSFCNKSEDILGLFTQACDMVEIRWRRSNAMIISIARRPDVARLDAMFGYPAAPQDI